MLLRGQTAALPFRRVCGCISLISWDWSRLIYSSLGIKEAMLCFFLLLWCPLPPLRWGGCSPARGRHFTGQQNHPSNFARLCQNTHHAVVFFSRVQCLDLSKNILRAKKNSTTYYVACIPLLAVILDPELKLPKTQIFTLKESLPSSPDIAPKKSEKTHNKIWMIKEVIPMPKNKFMVRGNLETPQNFDKQPL